MTCSYCFLSLNEGKASVLSENDLKRAIDAHRAAHPGGRVTLLGGEPALHWPLLRAAAAHAGAPLTVVTNGTILSPAQLGELQRSGAQVCVSLDGAAQANDASRKLLAGGSALEKALLTLEGADKTALRVNMVLTPANAGGLVKNLEFLRGRGFHRFSFHPDVMADWDEAAVAALRAALNGLKKYLQVAGKSVELAHSAAYAASCGGYDDTVLGADGYYYPCDGLFARPLAELAAYRCGSAANGLDAGARAGWHGKALTDIHSWIGSHSTCPREPYFQALVTDADPKEAVRRYAAADAALGEILCAAA